MFPLSDQLSIKNMPKHTLFPLVLGVGARFLAQAASEEVCERVQNYIKVGGKNGRFALYLCNLGATTPAENIRAAIEAVV